MYNHLYQYLTENKILYPKQFGFQTGHSAEHAIVQLVDQILESFEYNKYPLGVLIDLSKAFDTVDHSILLKKLELYGVTDRNRSWFKNYLSNRKQFLQINNEKNTELETITCGVPQGSILGPINAKVQSEVQPCGKIFQPIQKKSNKRPISLKP